MKTVAFVTAIRNKQIIIKFVLQYYSLFCYYFAVVVLNCYVLVMS